VITKMKTIKLHSVDKPPKRIKIILVRRHQKLHPEKKLKTPYKTKLLRQLKKHQIDDSPRLNQEIQKNLK